jgi:hypothetical protein
MALNSKHNRNDRRGQSLFTAPRRPWPSFVARRRAAGAFFMRTPAVGAGGVHKSVTARCSALIGAGRGGHQPPSGTSPPPGRRVSKVDGSICRSAAGRLVESRGLACPSASPPLWASGLLLAGLRVQGLSQAWSVADAHGSLRPWQATRASRATTVRRSYHGENEGRVGPPQRCESPYVCARCSKS